MYWIPFVFVKWCLQPHLLGLTLFSSILVKLLYDIGTAQDAWHNKIFLFPLQSCHLLEINHPNLNISSISLFLLWKWHLRSQNLFLNRKIKILTCCIGQYQASRWSLKECGWRWHFHTPLGSTGVCNRSTPARKHESFLCPVAFYWSIFMAYIFLLIVTYLLDPDVCGHHLVLLILI